MFYRAKANSFYLMKWIYVLCVSCRHNYKHRNRGFWLFVKTYRISTLPGRTWAM